MIVHTNLSDLQGEDSVRSVKSLLRIGIAERMMMQLKDAQETLSKVVSKCETKVKLKMVKSHAQMELGHVASLKKDFSQVEIYYLQALEVLKEGNARTLKENN